GCRRFTPVLVSVLSSPFLFLLPILSWETLPKLTDCDHRDHPPFPTPQSVGKRFFALQKNKLAPYRATKVYLWRTDGGLHLFPVVFPAIFPTETATYLLMQISS